MVSLRTVLHVLITLAVVAHGAWMAMMPLAHAMEAPASHDAIAAPMAASHDHHAHHNHHAEHHAANGHGAAHGEVADFASAAHLDHAGDGHTPDHEMVGCECTLCKITSLAAIETRLSLAVLPQASLAPRVDPAQAPRTTVGPPVGLRAPPVMI